MIGDRVEDQADLELATFLEHARTAPADPVQGWGTALVRRALCRGDGRDKPHREPPPTAEILARVVIPYPLRSTMKKIRALLGLAVLLAVAALSVGLSSPAHADFNPCPHGDRNPPCAVYVLWPPFEDDCHCPEYAIEFIEDRVLPVTQREQYVNDINNGLRLLDQADRTFDPAKVGQLRVAALNKFTAAAAALNGAYVQPSMVGVFVHESGMVDPVPMPWLVSAAEHLASGLNLLVWGPPTPEPAISEEAMKRFDTAYRELSKGVQSG